MSDRGPWRCVIYMLSLIGVTFSQIFEFLRSDGFLEGKSQDTSARSVPKYLVESFVLPAVTNISFYFRLTSLLLLMATDALFVSWT